MKLLQVLGPGCPKCDRLHANAAAAVAELGIDARVEKIADLDAILSFDVLITPALVIDGKVRLVGRVASVEEIKRWLA